MRVSSVNDNVTLFEVGLELFNKVVNSGTGLYEEDDLSGNGKLVAELLDRVGTNDVLA